MYTSEIGTILDKLSFDEAMLLLDNSHEAMYEYVITRHKKLDLNRKKLVQSTSTFIYNINKILTLSRDNEYYDLIQDVNNYTILAEFAKHKLTDEEIRLIISHFSNTNISVVYSYSVESPAEFKTLTNNTGGAVALFNNLLPGILASLNINVSTSTLLISTNKKTKYKLNYNVMDKWIEANSPETIKLILNTNSNLEQCAIMFDKYDNTSVEIIDVNSFYKFVLWLCKRDSKKIQTLVPLMDKLL